MSGGPSQMDLFDYKPLLMQDNGKELPDSVRQGSGSRACRPIRRRCRWPARSSNSRSMANRGAWLSELLPHTGDGRG